jgi:hypothetical protein
VSKKTKKSIQPTHRFCAVEVTRSIKVEPMLASMSLFSMRFLRVWLTIRLQVSPEYARLASICVSSTVWFVQIGLVLLERYA